MNNELIIEQKSDKRKTFGMNYEEDKRSTEEFRKALEQVKEFVKKI